MKKLKIAVVFLSLWTSMALAETAYMTDSAGQLYTGEGLEIKKAYIKFCEKNPENAKVYMTLKNNSDHEYVFLGGYSPAADETHLYAPENGKMSRVNKVMMDPGSKLKLSPGEMHLKMIDVNESLHEGMRVPVCLKFEKVAPALCMDMLVVDNK